MTRSKVCDDYISRYRELCDLTRQKLAKSEARRRHAEQEWRRADLDSQCLQELVDELRATLRVIQARGRRVTKDTEQNMREVLREVARRERHVLATETELAVREADITRCEQRLRLREVQLAASATACEQRAAVVAEMKEVLRQSSAAVTVREIQSHARYSEREQMLQQGLADLKRETDANTLREAEWVTVTWLARHVFELEKQELAARQTCYKDELAMRTSLSCTLLRNVLQLGCAQHQVAEAGMQALRREQAKLAESELHWRDEVRRATRRRVDDHAQLQSMKEDLVLQCYAVLRNIRAAAAAVQGAAGASPRMTLAMQRAEDALRGIAAMHIS